MGAQKSGLMNHVEKLTEQLSQSWQTIATVLAGRLRMQNINLLDGDLLVLQSRADASAPEMESLSFAAQRLARSLGRGIQVIVMRSGQELCAVDPALMEEAGWQRKPAPAPESTTA